jgi:hypothetical protein
MRIPAHRAWQLVRVGSTACALFAAGCLTSTEPSAASVDRCQQVIDRMAERYPDLATDASCTAETVAAFDQAGLATASCESIGDMGKADWLAAGGCDAGQHVCGWIFCCDDYLLTWFPSSGEDWNVVPVVDALHAALPWDVAADAADATGTELESGVSWHYEQDVAEAVGGSPVPLAVEYTQQLVDVPYSDFSAIIPAESWGVDLDHYLGGEVKNYSRDSLGRATAQLERMVLSPLPCDWESPLSNNDMTKVEVIDYQSDRARVSWRVMYSNNDSTVTDVGSVQFEAYDEASTLITFHSAHRLNAPGGIPIPLSLLGPALSSTFLDFTQHYREIAEAAQ